MGSTSGRPRSHLRGPLWRMTPITRAVQTFEWDGMPGHVILET
ncbi:MAG: hypothetical protein Q8N23_05280 [Archangium sp.]|nr:hypothetical protein [Archangium sp.]MDP3575455.1 hypothetical protein [Archangium sp.]